MYRVDCARKPDNTPGAASARAIGGTMMIGITLLLLLSQAPSARETQTEVQKLTKMVAESGRVLEIAVPATERASPPMLIAPGSPPLISFRFFEGQVRHRFGNLDLVTDDAGH
jgi:hypothetical protein